MAHRGKLCSASEDCWLNWKIALFYAEKGGYMPPVYSCPAIIEPRVNQGEGCKVGIHRKGVEGEDKGATFGSIACL